MMKEDKKLFTVYKDVFDTGTIKAVWKLITENHIEGLESPIKIGKESNIFSALTKKNKRIAVKIHRILASDFFTIAKYLAMDTRFRVPGGRRKLIIMWAMREFKNLQKAKKEGVSVPEPIAIEENALVMQFIGEKFPKMPQPAPLLKDSCDKPEEYYAQVLQNLKILYQKAKIVHGDLSEFNMLNWKGKIIIIDLSHSIPVLSAESNTLLERDVVNVCRFFNKKGLKLNVQEVMKEIKTGAIK